MPNRISVSGSIAAAVLIALVCCALVPGALSPYDPLAIDPAEAFTPPSSQHWFGTDASGRDLFSRVITGTRTSLTIGVLATLSGVLGGAVLGILAAASTTRWFAPLRWASDRTIEGLFAFPSLLFALLLLVIIGPGTWSIIIAVSISTVPGFARMLRGGIRQALTSGVVETARIQGDHTLRIWIRYVLPTAFQPVVVLATLGVGYAVLVSAALGFLGFGAPPPAPEWGSLLNDGRPYLTKAWWLTFFPGMAIALVGVATTVLGKALDRTEGPHS